MPAIRMIGELAGTLRHGSLFSVIDKTFTKAGGVALWTKADGVRRFDELTITTLPQGSD